MTQFRKDWLVSQPLFRRAIGMQFLLLLGVAASARWLLAGNASLVEPQMALLVFTSLGFGSILAFGTLRDDLRHPTLPFALVRPMDSSSLLRTKLTVSTLEALALAAVGLAALLAFVPIRQWSPAHLWPVVAVAALAPVVFVLAASARLARLETFVAAGVLATALVLLLEPRPAPLLFAALVLAAGAPLVAPRLASSPRAQAVVYVALVASGAAVILGLLASVGAYLAAYSLIEGTDVGARVWGVVQGDAAWVPAFLAPAWFLVAPLLPPIGIAFVPGARDLPAVWLASASAPSLLVGLVALLAGLRFARSFATRAWELPIYAGIGFAGGAASLGAFALARFFRIPASLAASHPDHLGPRLWTGAPLRATRVASLAACVAAGALVLVRPPWAERSPIAGYLSGERELHVTESGFVQDRSGGVWEASAEGWRRRFSADRSIAWRVFEGGGGSSYAFLFDDDWSAVRVARSTARRELELRTLPSEVSGWIPRVAALPGAGLLLVSTRSLPGGIDRMAAWRYEWDSGQLRPLRVEEASTGRAVLRRSGELIFFADRRAGEAAVGATVRGEVVIERAGSLSLALLPGFQPARAGSPRARVFTGVTGAGRRWIVFAGGHVSPSGVAAYREEKSGVFSIVSPDELRLVSSGQRRLLACVGREGVWFVTPGASVGELHVVRWSPDLRRATASVFANAAYHPPTDRVVEAGGERLAIARGEGPILVLEPGRSVRTVPAPRPAFLSRTPSDGAWLFGRDGERRTVHRWSDGRLSEVPGGVPFWN